MGMGRGMSIPSHLPAGGGMPDLSRHTPAPPRNALQSAWNAVIALFAGRWLTASSTAPALTPSRLTSQAIYAHVQGLRAELQTAMEAASATLPAASRQAFAARAAAMVNDVLVECMNPVVDESERRSDRDVKLHTFQKASRKARLLVDRHLQVARGLERGKMTAPEVRAVWVQNPAGPHLPKVERLVVMRAAPPLEHLVLRGGGAKGIGNPPALRALENLGKLSDLKKVVGTSAGALTAVCLASGMSAQAFQRLSNDTGMLSLLSSPGGFKNRYPEVKLGLIGFGAGKALETLDRASAGAVRSYLRDHWDDGEAWNSLGAADRARLVSLRDQDLERSPRTAQMITFRDLQLLHQLAPARFKELVLTGYNTDKKETTYFSATSHPDMPVALAGRVSMSIPVFFKPVKMDFAGQTQNFVDGGVGSNMPSEAILDGLHGKDMDDAMARTLLMTYDEGGAAYSLLHGSPAERKNASGGLMSRWTNDRLDAEKIHFSGSNVLPVFHGKLGTFSFNASKEQVEQAQTQSMLNTLEYMDTTMGQAQHDLVTDVDAAVRLLSVDEQRGFLQRHGEDADPLHAAMCDAIRVQLPAAGAAQA